MMIILLDGVHRVVGVVPGHVPASNGTVADGAAIVPSYGGVGGNRLNDADVFVAFFAIFLARIAVSS